MDDIILHVGLPKTGSTYLQKEFFPALPGTDLRSTYPEILRFIARCTDGDLRRLNSHAKKQQLEAMLKDIDRPIILSHEGFCGDPVLGFHNVPSVASFFHTILPEARVLLTLRRQDEFISSYYTQYLQTYHWMSMDEFLPMDDYGELIPLNLQWVYSGNYPRLHADILDWNDLIKQFEAAFGQDRVFVSLYEDFVVDPGQYLERMAAAIGAPLPTFVKGKRINASYTQLSAKIAVILNRLIRSPHNPCGFIVNRPFNDFLSARKDRNRLYKMLWRVSQALDIRTILQVYINRLPSKRFQPMTEAQRTAVMEYHASGNAALDARRELGMKRHGYY